MGQERIWNRFATDPGYRTHQQSRKTEISITKIQYVKAPLHDKNCNTEYLGDRKWLLCDHTFALADENGNIKIFQFVPFTPSEKQTIISHERLHITDPAKAMMEDFSGIHAEKLNRLGTEWMKHCKRHGLTRTIEV